MVDQMVDSMVDSIMKAVLMDELIVIVKVQQMNE